MYLYIPEIHRNAVSGRGFVLPLSSGERLELSEQDLFLFLAFFLSHVRFEDRQGSGAGGQGGSRNERGLAIAADVEGQLELLLLLRRAHQLRQKVVRRQSTALGWSGRRRLEHGK